MSSHLKAYIVVFAVSAMVLFYFRGPFAKLVGSKRVNNWAIIWLVMTSCAFLLSNYWIFLLVSGGLAFVLSRSEPTKPAIYLLLLCLVPTLGEAIPGFAGITKFIEVNPQLVIAAVILFPVMFVSRHMKKINKVGSGADLFFLLFLLLQLSLSIRAESFTHMLRTAIQDFLLLAPLYYVFSRYPKTFNDIRVLSAAFLLPVLVLSAISIPEFVRNWHFYYSITTNWFGSMPFGYVLREGYLRASSSLFNPIVWGFVAMCGLGVGLAVLNDGVSRLYRYSGFAVLAAGLIVSLSRGPWIGFVAILGVYILLSRRMITRTIQAGAFGAIAFVAALATPFGTNIVGLIPFLGNKGDETISYRQQLLDQAWDVILENPFFGSGDFLANSSLQSLRQGQGIIDIVNTYLQVGLKSGLIGLSLFIGFFFVTLLRLFKVFKKSQQEHPIFANYCRAYIATLIGILLTIFTTSNVGQTEYLYWIFGGLGVALSRIGTNLINGVEYVAPTARANYEFN